MTFPQLHHQPPISSLAHTEAAPTRARCGRRPRCTVPSRASVRLATQGDGTFVPMATKAIQRKAIQESLEACSTALKKQIKGRRILKRKNAIGALDLGRLARTASLSCSNREAIAVAAAPTLAT